MGEDTIEVWIFITRPGEVVTVSFSQNGGIDIQDPTEAMYNLAELVAGHGIPTPD